MQVLKRVIELKWLMRSIERRIVWENPSLNNGCNDHWLDFTFLPTEIWIISVPFLRNRRVKTYEARVRITVAGTIRYGYAKFLKFGIK